MRWIICKSVFPEVVAQQEPSFKGGIWKEITLCLVFFNHFSICELAEKSCSSFQLWGKITCGRLCLISKILPLNFQDEAEERPGFNFLLRMFSCLIQLNFSCIYQFWITLKLSKTEMIQKQLHSSLDLQLEDLQCSWFWSLESHKTAFASQLRNALSCHQKDYFTVCMLWGSTGDAWHSVRDYKYEIIEF